MKDIPGAAKDRRHLVFAMNLSLWVGVLMLIIKMTAYILTNSTAILSDAAESVVHIAAVSFAAYSLRLSYKPADSNHLFGHAKISFFSAGFEGAMIVGAALFIIYTAVVRWLAGLELQNLDLGTGLIALSLVINGALGTLLVRIGKKKNSIILAANGKHVLTDFWTSLGVLVGLALTWATGWLPWDPIFAIITALNILFSGFGLISASVGGLMDKADAAVSKKLTKILDEETGKHGIQYHSLRHRNLGNRQAVELHLVFPGNLAIQGAHEKATSIERVVEQSFTPEAYVVTHLEALEDHSQVHAHKPH